MNKKKKISRGKKLKLFRFSLNNATGTDYVSRHIRAASLYHAYTALTLDEIKRLPHFGVGNRFGFHDIRGSLSPGHVELLANKYTPQGALYVYKKVWGVKIDDAGYVTTDFGTTRIIRLYVPSTAARVYIPWGNSDCKMRASEVGVLRNNPVGISGYDNSFWYVPGQRVKPKKDFNREMSICESGIHFYLTEEQAKKHLM